MKVNQLDMFEAQTKFAQAERVLQSRLKTGVNQEKTLVDLVAKMVIMDKLVPPKMMDFRAVPGRVLIQYEGTEGEVQIHRHALNQLCAKVHLPMHFVNDLLTGDPRYQTLLAHNLFELFHIPDWKDKDGQSVRFLHRLVGNQLRGFLSRRFNRWLASAPLLRTFSEECRAVGATPVEAYSSDIRSSLKCLMPKVFEVFPGEYIAVGVEWSNSDFGSGKLKVAQTLWRIFKNTGAVVDSGINRAHIGSILEDSDLEMSDDTARKEVIAQQGAIKDHVHGFLSETSVERLLAGIRIARTKEIPWSKLEKQLKGILTSSELDWMNKGLTEEIIDLPSINQGIPDAYWAASAVSSLASKTKDVDRRMSLQQEAGKLLAAAMEAA
jgi:hypothetical protein